MYEKFKTIKYAREIVTIQKDIEENGGRGFFVGGVVRDMILGNNHDDIDIEVYGMSIDMLDSILAKYGTVVSVGKHFGILKLNLGESTIDFSVPRKDSKVGVGHKGFQVDYIEDFSFFEATKRRDFTMNAILYDPLADELIDPHNGIHDIQAQILRVTDMDLFGDDPLRVFRAIRFASRLDFVIDEISEGIIKKMIPSLQELSLERIGEEWRKIFLQSKNPRTSLELMDKFGIIDRYYSEISLLKGVPQDKKWHPEGDVWIHTLMVLEQAYFIALREKFDEDEKLILLFSALCHDFGKVTHTQIHEDRISAHGHEGAGIPPTRNFLKLLCFPESFIDRICGIIESHVAPIILYSDTRFRGIIHSDGVYRRLAKKIFPGTMIELSYLCEADQLGRGYTLDYAHTSSLRSFLPGVFLREIAVRNNILNQPPDDIIRGSELLELGMLPGKEIGETIKMANSLRDDEGKSKEEIIEHIKAKIRMK